MPPKKKGHTVAGKAQIFRHAVQHVRLGLGHAVLGDLHLSLAAGRASSTPIGVHGGSADEVMTSARPAFYLELNQQLLSHSSKDFKKFRWEVLELCETIPLFHLHHRQLAHRLLQCLMHRGHSMSTATSADAKDGEAAAAAEEEEAREVGKTTEAYEAFARLSIAFARDMGDGFLRYYEVFQQAVEAGIYDASGRFSGDTKRLQLIYAVQAAWCRELKMHWGNPVQIHFVRRIVRVYIVQLHDTKEYVRRLSAELLAFLCRLCPSLLPLVVEEACGDVLDSYVVTSSAAAAVTSTPSDVEPLHSDVVEGAGESESEDDEEEAEENGSGSGVNSTVATAASSLASPWTRRGPLVKYARQMLPHHPVMDGMVYFVAELFRGMKGALSSSFESHYVRLLVAFSLLPSSSSSLSEEAAAAHLFSHS